MNILSFILVSYYILVYVGFDCVLCIEVKFFVFVGRWMLWKLFNFYNFFNFECFCKLISNYVELCKWDNFFIFVGDEYFFVIGKGIDFYFICVVCIIKLYIIICISKCKICVDLIVWNLFVIIDCIWYIE